MSLYFEIIKKREIVNTNNVKNVIRIIRSSCVLIITKYKDMFHKVTVNKFLTGNTRYFYVASTTSLQVWTNVIPSLVQVIKEENKSEQKSVCVKMFSFWTGESSVFIDVRTGTDGPLNMWRSLITKGLPPSIRDRPDIFCSDVVKV